MTPFIYKLLRHKLGVHATGCTHAYTLPCSDDAYEPVAMQIDGGRGEGMAREQRVMFMVFPGLDLQGEDAGNMTALRAAVKVHAGES